MPVRTLENANKLWDSCSVTVSLALLLRSPSASLRWALAWSPVGPESGRQDFFNESEDRWRRML